MGQDWERVAGEGGAYLVRRAAEVQQAGRLSPTAIRLVVEEAERLKFMLTEVERALSLDNREFKDAPTNQKTKGVRTDARDAQRAPRKSVSLKDDHTALLNRRFSEIAEIKKIG